MQEITDHSNEKWIINTGTTQQYVHFFKNILNPFVIKIETFYYKRLKKLKRGFYSLLKNNYFQLKLNENYENFNEIFQYECQITLVITIGNILLSKIFLIKNTIIRSLKEFERNKIIFQQKTFVNSQKMLVYKNIIIGYCCFFARSKLITKVFFRKWFYGKYSQRILKARGRKIIENYLIRRQSTFYIERKDSIRLLMLYQRITMLIQQYDVLWLKTYSLIQLVSPLIMSMHKSAKSKLLYLLTPDLSINELNKIKLHHYKEFMSFDVNEDIKAKIEREIKQTQLRMLPEHNEEMDNNALCYIVPLLYRKALLNNTIVSYFNKWSNHAKILNSTETKITKAQLTDLIIYSKISLMVLVIQTKLKCAICHFVYCVKRYYLSSPMTIYSLENITNAKLVGIIDGLVKMYYFLISSDYHKRIAPKSLQGDVYWNRRNRQFYLWRYLNYWVVPHRFVIGLTIINEYNVDLMYKYKYLFFSMLKSNATKIDILAKVTVLLNVICDSITIGNMPYRKYLFIEKVKLRALNRDKQKLFYLRTNINGAIDKITKMYSKELFNKMNWKAFSVVQYQKNKKVQSNNNRGFALIKKIMTIRNIFNNLIMTIYSNCFSGFYTSIRAFNKKNYYNKRGKQSIENRIVENMITVTLSIHNDIHSRAKMLKRVKFTKAIYLISERHLALRQVKHSLINAFNKWKACSISVMQNIEEDKEFQTDIKLKVNEYQEGIDFYEDNLGEIAVRCETCKVCSKLLRASYSDQGQTDYKNNEIDGNDNDVLINHIQITQPKLNIQNDNEEDILDDEYREDGYFAYLEKTGNELREKIIQLKNEKDPLCEELKKEVEALCKEVDDLSNLNIKKK